LKIPIILVTKKKRLTFIGGELVALPRGNQSKITDINKWTNGFLAYATVYLAAHQMEIQNLLKYMRDIRLGAERRVGLRWKIYDENFA